MTFQPGSDSDTARLGALHVERGAARGAAFAIVASRFNDAIVERLVAGARQTLLAAGAADENVAIYRCPGALELPGVVRRVAELGRFQGVVVLGCVIRGDTPHFDLVVGESTRGVGVIAAEGKVAVANGVLACNTLEQAVARAVDGPGNRGAEAATVAVEMVEVYARLEAEAQPRRQDLPRRK